MYMYKIVITRLTKFIFLFTNLPSYLLSLQQMHRKKKEKGKKIDFKNFFFNVTLRNVVYTKQ